jgi:hypothetical protein
VSKPGPSDIGVYCVIAILTTLVVVSIGSPAAGHSVGLSYNPPAVADGQLYVTSADGHLYALERDGEPRWTVNASAEITTSATVDGDTVLFGTGDGRLLAVARGDGTVRWERQLAAGDVTSVAVGTRRIYVGSDSGVVAVDREGSVIWEFETEGFLAAPVVANGHGVYVAASSTQAREGTLSALDPRGNVRWVRETNDTVEQVAAGDRTVYHTAGGRVVATATNGSHRWTVELSRVISQPVVRDGRVVVGTIGGTVAAISDGAVVWRYRTDLPVAPTVAGETVYATTPTGVVALRNGTKQWDRSIGTTVLEPPTVGKHVYVGTQMNRTYAVTEGGSFAWTNRYSTTTADVPWADGHAAPEFWNPRGSVTRVVGPDGDVRTQRTGGVSGLGTVAAVVVGIGLSVATIGYGLRRRRERASENR